MFISDGWGARLRREREKRGLSQHALAHRNTQGAYESEKNAPDVRYLQELPLKGLDLHFILTGDAESEGSLSSDEQELVAAFRALSTEIRAALLAIARELGSKAA